MKTEDFEEKRRMVLLANADYETQMEDPPYGFNIRKIEKQWGLNENQLLNFRANYKRRLNSGVSEKPLIGKYKRAA